LITFLGGISLGIVWGWLLGNFDQPRREQLVVVSLAGASLALGTTVTWLAGLRTVPAFAIAAVVSLLIHRLWWRELRHRYQDST